jgi:site-specific recombinase XerD
MNAPSSATVLAPFLGDFERSLRERGYTPRTVNQYAGRCRTFDGFLVERGMALESLAGCAVAEFLADKLPRRAHRDERSARGWWTRPLYLLLEHLQRAGAVPCTAAPAPPEPPIILEYVSFLRDHRGVSTGTIESQKRYLMRFLDHMGATRETDIPAHVSPDKIDRFLVAHSGRLCRQSINLMCSALRGFLRYLHMLGLIKSNLAAQVTRPRIYSLANIPRALDWHDVERTLALADRTTLTGCRDYAILVLLAYCGLRGGEVAGLRLVDVDWSHDTIQLHRPKCKTVDPIPLVPLVGEALIGYLRRRPAAPFPQVFLKVLAPAGPMSSSCITMLTRKYLLLAGSKLQRLGAHTLRHSYAVRLLRQGFPLKTIGDALGHLHPQSTFIYAKAAVDDLRSVSLDVTEVLS